MKTYLTYLFVILLSSLAFTACEENDDLTGKDIQSLPRLTRGEECEDTTFFESTLNQRMQIAEWLAHNLTLEETEKLHNIVTDAVNAGLDEIVYLKEYASAQSAQNKISQQKSTAISEKFKEDMQAEKAEGMLKTYSSGYLESYILDNDRLHIYWPYSEDWDHETMPVVAYAPEMISSPFAYGYRCGPKANPLFLIRIDEEYCQTHPVLIISESETPYSELPDFARGERISKSGVYFSGPAKEYGGSVPRPEATVFGK